MTTDEVVDEVAQAISVEAYLSVTTVLDPDECLRMARAAVRRIRELRLTVVLSDDC